MNYQDEESEHLMPQNERELIEGGSSTSLRVSQAVWGMWWVGTILIVLSWFGIVSNFIGWIGFAAALASTFVSVIANKFWKAPK